jgi:hypothetical protein
MILALDPDDGGGGDERTRLVRFLLIHEDAAGHNQGAGPLAAWNQAAVHKEFIQPDFRVFQG